MNFLDTGIQYIYKLQYGFLKKRRIFQELYLAIHIPILAYCIYVVYIVL